jgi:hypothetical protein
MLASLTTKWDFFFAWGGHFSSCIVTTKSNTPNIILRFFSGWLSAYLPHHHRPSAITPPVLPSLLVPFNPSLHPSYQSAPPAPWILMSPPQRRWSLLGQTVTWGNPHWYPPQRLLMWMHWPSPLLLLLDQLPRLCQRLDSLVLFHIIVYNNMNSYYSWIIWIHIICEIYEFIYQRLHYEFICFMLWIHRLVLILAGSVCFIWDFFLVQVYARVDLYLFSTVS